MVNIEPYVEVNDVERITQVSYGNAGKLAVIGAFPTNTFKLDVFTDLDACKNALLGDYKLPNDNSVENASKTVVPDTFVSFYCLDYVFMKNKQSGGAESVLIVNTNYGKNSLATSSTNADINTACGLLADEDFDILNIAEPIAVAVQDNSTYILNPIISTLKTFSNNQYKNQKPFGIITGFDMANVTSALLTEFKNLWKDKGIFKAVTTPIRMNGDANSLSIAQSGCWQAGFTAGRPVNKSETMKVYDGIIGESTKDVFTGSITTQNLLDAGFHTQKYKNRRDKVVQCISNITPCDYDMKIERIKNFMIKRLTLADRLGDDNDYITRDLLKGLFIAERERAIESRLLVDMDFNFINTDTDKVKAEVKFYINDIIRVFILNVSLEITAYEEE